MINKIYKYIIKYNKFYDKYMMYNIFILYIYIFFSDYVFFPRYVDSVHDPASSFLLQTRYAQFLPLALCCET